MPHAASMPKSRLRRGARTYEIRVRVPEAARGGRFKATHTTWSLEATRLSDAYRNLSAVHDALMREFATEEALLMPWVPRPALMRIASPSPRSSHSTRDSCRFEPHLSTRSTSSRCHPLVPVRRRISRTAFPRLGRAENGNNRQLRWEYLSGETAADARTSTLLSTP